MYEIKQICYKNVSLIYVINKYNNFIIKNNKFIYVLIEKIN